VVVDIPDIAGKLASAFEVLIFSSILRLFFVPFVEYLLCSLQD
jgi:hypothetical protein